MSDASYFVSATDSAQESVVIHPKRRNVELVMCLFAGALGLGGWALTNFNQTGAIPGNWPVVVAAWLGVCLTAHFFVRWKAPWADPVLLPCVLALNGLGLAMIARLDLASRAPTAPTQLLWTVLGVAAFAAVLIFVRDYRSLQRFPYLLFLVGLGLLLLPLVPVLGQEINGSRIWIRVAGFSFQPAELAKIVLTLAFASYLADRSDVLQLAGRKVLGVRVPRLRDLVPILIMWGAAVVVLVFQNDLGTSLLFFGLFVMMMYVSTNQGGWVALAGVLFAAAALLVYQFAGHVRVRVESWLDPFANFAQNGQIIEGSFGMAWGGLTGRGWGLGRPWQIPLANSDFIFAALGEELGLIGMVCIVMVYAILVFRGLRTALSSHDGFGKLLAAGLSFTFALQTFAIIGGVTRLLPLTGLTTPFMSQGGSSMLSNWVIVALLMRVSHQARMPVITTAETEPYADLGAETTSLIAAQPGIPATGRGTT